MFARGGSGISVGQAFVVVRQGLDPRNVRAGSQIQGRGGRSASSPTQKPSGLGILPLPPIVHSAPNRRIGELSSVQLLTFCSKVVIVLSSHCSARVAIGNQHRPPYAHHAKEFLRLFLLQIAQERGTSEGVLAISLLKRRIGSVRDRAKDRKIAANASG